MSRWFQDQNGRKYHMPCDPTDDDSPEGVKPRIFDINNLPLTIKLPENRTGFCSKCGQCCSHPADSCPTPSNCGYEYRKIKGKEWHVCSELATTNRQIGDANSTLCRVYSVLCDMGRKGCAIYPMEPEEVTEFMTNCTFEFV